MGLAGQVSDDKGIRLFSSNRICSPGDSVLPWLSSFSGYQVIFNLHSMLSHNSHTPSKQFCNLFVLLPFVYLDRHLHIYLKVTKSGKVAISNILAGKLK